MDSFFPTRFFLIHMSAKASPFCFLSLSKSFFIRKKNKSPKKLCCSTFVYVCVCIRVFMYLSCTLFHLSQLSNSNGLIEICPLENCKRSPLCVPFLLAVVCELVVSCQCHVFTLFTFCVCTRLGL